jgi:hypothetical protein
MKCSVAFISQVWGLGGNSVAKLLALSAAGTHRQTNAWQAYPLIRFIMYSG